MLAVFVQDHPKLESQLPPRRLDDGFEVVDLSREALILSGRRRFYNKIVKYEPRFRCGNALWCTMDVRDGPGCHNPGV